MDTASARWRTLTVHSAALEGNPLGDPAARPLFICTPPGYEQEPARRYPVVYVLHAMTAQARSMFNVSPFEPTVAQLIEQASLELIVAVPDGYSSLGGAQWVDSPAIGNYGSYLCDEVVGTVDRELRTLPHPGHRGLAGASSGGFGAALWAMRRPDLFAAFASHAADCLFEVTLAAEFGPAAQALRNLYDGSFARFWESMRSGRAVFDNPSDPLLQNVYATAAAFSPDLRGGVELPFAIETGVPLPEVWSRWQAWDPVRLAAGHPDAVASLRAVWIDAGRHDEYRLDLGAVALRDALCEAGLARRALHFELFDGGHRRLSRRLPQSLAFLAARLG